MHKRYVIRIALATAFILLMLLLVNQFTDEMVWKPGDFVVAGVLLFSAGLAYRFLTRKVSTTAYRVAIALAIGMVFLLIWAELAVGIFGTPFAGS